jgi:MarR family 2-MHQ and catechol resistance regulon transcriptional repressor
MPTHYTGTVEEIIALNTFIKLTRATESLNARLAAKGTLGNLTITQFGVLEVLYHLGPMCQNEIGAKLLKSGGNITLVIDNLEKRSLVKRQASPEDRRRRTITLTETGRKLIQEVLPVHVQAITAEMSVLNPQEQSTLANLCLRLGKKD